MKYRRFGQKILLHLNPGEEVAEYVREVYRAEKAALGEVSGLEAASETGFGVLDATEKKYHGESFKGNYETAPLTGSITQQGENPYFHLRTVIGNPLVGECHGGHLNRAAISTIAEILTMVIDGIAGRRMDESIGLNLVEFTQA